ncbi:unnamed protein product, partial [Iphiclides podalirius]
MHRTRDTSEWRARGGAVAARAGRLLRRHWPPPPLPPTHAHALLTTSSRLRALSEISSRFGVDLDKLIAVRWTSANDTAV